MEQPTMGFHVTSVHSMVDLSAMVHVLRDFDLEDGADVAGLHRFGRGFLRRLGIDK
ncbi:hypothetical protein [Mesorhizobium sp. M0276]|uniref:hypothetical protein n=1 Tax=Mesorhizobium sp. M0276 TaxID=2956928 RepID=UPI003334AA41